MPTDILPLPDRDLPLPSRDRKGAVFHGLAALAVILVLTTACAERLKPASAVAPAPVPAAPQDPPALVVAQTALELPLPQPIPAEAVPNRELPPLVPAPAETTVAHPTPRRRTAEAASESTPESASEPPAQPAQHASTNRAPLVPADPNLPSVVTIQKRIARVEALDAQIRAKPMPEDVKMIHNRIRYFLDQASRALARKDLREADSLSSRAMVLAEDLLGVH